VGPIVHGGAMEWIALVGPEIEENLSLRYLAAALERSGFDTRILGYHHGGQFGSVVDAIVGASDPPLLVGLSMAFQWRALDIASLAMALRQRGHAGHVTAGGHFGTFAGRELLADFPEIDSICRHEAEDTISALATALSNGTDLGAVRGLYFRAPDASVVDTGLPAVPAIDAIAWPDRRVSPARCFDHAIAPLVSSRGCYANCTFCCIAAWHEETLPGKRYRVRDVKDVAREMAHEQAERGIEIFVFHDDNFFVPGHGRNLDRIEALADALEEVGIGPFATVVKARPTDVRADVFEALQSRLRCIRAYIGVETDSEQGLHTLRRWSRPRQNHEAIEVVRALDLYTCFNLLVFDPDTTLDTLETNIAFMEYATEFPFNFGRVELYAGTPLLQRMQREGRVHGDYFQWDYDLGGPEIQRAFELTMAMFDARNFSDKALNNLIMGMRFDVEVARAFHPDAFEVQWLDTAKDLSRRLSADNARRLRAIVERVREGADPAGDRPFTREHASAMRRFERELWAECTALAATIQDRLGVGPPLTEIGDRVATPLQRAREVTT
jgi:radical SAM superfamily enzyme YgiQ (UPF0313 family)